MTYSKSSFGEVEFELRYEADGNKVVLTGVATANISNYSEWEELIDIRRKTRNETTITLENVANYSVTMQAEQPNIYMDNLPEAPFGYTWEVHPHYDEFILHHPGSMMDEEIRRVSTTRWYLKMVDADDYAPRQYVISKLDDDTLRMAANILLDEHLTHSRAEALKNGPMKLIGSDLAPNQ